MGFLAPLLGAVLPGLLGGIAGSSNPRPPALNPGQSNALNNLLSPSGNLYQTATQPVTIDPRLQAYMFGQNAQSLTGANNALTHALVSRGLGRSGLLAQGLFGNQQQSMVNQGNINQNLLQQAYQQKQLSLQDILGLLNVTSEPGAQSGFGAFMAGMAPLAAYSLQSQMNNRYANPNGGSTGYWANMDNAALNSFNAANPANAPVVGGMLPTENPTVINPIMPYIGPTG